MTTSNEFLRQLGTGPNLRDYQHASKIFVSDNFRLSPKQDFLYHVEFDLNKDVIGYPNEQLLEVGILVKNANLPKYRTDTKTFNAYNRPNVVQSKIKYDPVTITFHDDSADVVRNFWYAYYSYFYRDSDYDLTTYQQPHLYTERTTKEWGYTPRDRGRVNRPRIINAIKIYSLHRKQFTEYVLVNPVITAFQHGDHASDGNGTMQHTMTVEFETVLYQYGWIAPDQNTSFATLHYDKTPSPLTPQGGGTTSIFGPGGAVAGIDGVIYQLGQGDIFGAGISIWRGIQNFEGKDLGKIAVDEFKQIGKDIINGQNPLNKIQIPTLGGLISGGGAVNSGPQTFGTPRNSTTNTVFGQQTGGPSSPTGATEKLLAASPANTPVHFNSINDLLAGIGTRSTGSTFAGTVSSNGEAVAQTFPVNITDNINSYPLQKQSTNQGKIN